MSHISHSDLIKHTTEIVSAHLSNQTVKSDDIPVLIESVYKSLLDLSHYEIGRPKTSLVPAVPKDKSVFPNYIICLEDGKKLKMLKRHLKAAYNMTPEDYREKWGLPADYPMVAPSYAKKRSRLAKDIGLGKK